MTSNERVLNACRFQRPDRIPVFDSFWSYPDSWRERLGDPASLTDIAIWCPSEGAFSTREKTLKTEGGWIYAIDSWGRTVRSQPGCYFTETLRAPLEDGVDIDAVHFDSPELDSRYLQGQATLEEAAAVLERDKQRHCVFGKTGGPYLRTCFVRGEVQFLMDMAGDESLARALAEKMARHLLACGTEAIRRWSLQETGIWIYDDMACNKGPMFSPRTFERVLLGAYRQMINAYRAAGAKYVFLHSDGNIMPILDMLVDAGIDGINPIETRTGMDMATIRRRFPRLILTGGMDNTDTLINGPLERIEKEARDIIDMGRDGGVVIGTHSISPEVPVEHFMAYRRTCETYGDFQR